MRGGFLALAIISTVIAATARAQVPPTVDEVGSYTGLHAAAASGDTAAIAAELARGAAVDGRDGRARTPLHVATFRKHADAVRALEQIPRDVSQRL